MSDLHTDHVQAPAAVPADLTSLNLLNNIKTDAAQHASSPDDSQTANRLGLEVFAYLQHHSDKSGMGKLDTTLKASGLSQPEIQKLEHSNLPKLSLSNDDGLKNTPHSKLEEPCQPAAQQAIKDAERGNQTPATVDAMVKEVHQAEDHYVFDHNNTTPFGEARKEQLQQAWTDTQKFANDHPDQVPELVAKLQEQDLISQLSIAALNKSVTSLEQHGGRVDSLSPADATGLITRQDALGDALRQHLQSSYAMQPGEGFGGGYADNQETRSTNGQTSEQPVITRHHLDNLMTDFTHPPNYLSETATEAKNQSTSIWPNWLRNF